MTKLEKYKWATIILSIFVFVTIVVMLDDQDVTDQMQSMLGKPRDLSGCQMAVVDWSSRYQYKVGFTGSAAAKSELSSILSSCSK